MDASILKDGKKVFERKAASYSQLNDITDVLDSVGFAYSETRWKSKFAFETDFVNEKGEKVTLSFI